MITNFWGEARKIWTDVSGNTIENERLAFELEMHKKLLSIFQVGEYYYFIFNIHKGEFEYMSPSIKDILGFEPDITTAYHLSHLHPEDQPYFLNFENKGREFFRSLPVDKIGKYKIRYDFRIQHANGSYVRILHQMVFIQHDDQGNLLRSLGVHTDISHLKESGRPVMSFIGLEGEPSFINIQVQNVFRPSKNLLTGRETDILMLLAAGRNSSQIGNGLNITKSTVDTHRRNILKKTNCISTYELISKAINEGWI